MTPEPGPRLRTLLEWVRRIVDNVYLWGILGWLLIFLRYSTDLIHPRYGG